MYTWSWMLNVTDNIGQGRKRKILSLTEKIHTSHGKDKTRLGRLHRKGIDNSHLDLEGLEQGKGEKHEKVTSSASQTNKGDTRQTVATTMIYKLNLASKLKGKQLTFYIPKQIRTKNRK